MMSFFMALVPRGLGGEAGRTLRAALDSGVPVLAGLREAAARGLDGVVRLS